MLIAKQRIISEQIVEIDKKINNLKLQENREESLFDVKSRIEQFDADIARINVDVLATKKIINDLDRERRNLEDWIVKSVKCDNPLIPRLHKLISGYAIRLGLDSRYVSERNDYIFTSDLKSLTGAVFHKVVFAFKISYVKLIQEQTGLFLPIILDSPNGREVSLENVKEMMAILVEDFSAHQIIIASIYSNYSFADKTIIEIKDRLLPF